MKKIAALFLLFLLLCGCAGPNGPDESQSSESSLSSLAQQSSVPESQTVPVPIPDSDETFAFVIDGFEHYEILSTVLDEKTDSYAVVYAASSSDLPDIFSDRTANIQVQIFSKAGVFLKRIETAVQPKNIQDAGTYQGTVFLHDGTLGFPAKFLSVNKYVLMDIFSAQYTLLDGDRFCPSGSYLLSLKETYLGEKAYYLFTLYHKQTPLWSSTIEAFLESQNTTWDPQQNPGANRQIFIELDPENFTAKIGDSKTLCTVDFARNTHEITRTYTEEMLETFLFETPDEKWQFYLADVSANSCDAVRVDKKSRAITYLADCTGPDRSYLLGHENQLLISHFASSVLVNYETAEILDPSFGLTPEQNTVLLGALYDSENECYLLATRPWPEENSEPSLPITIEVLSPTGERIKQIDTGFDIEIATQNGTFKQVLMELDGTGGIILAKQAQYTDDFVRLGVVKYK